METHVQSESDSRVTQPWNKDKLTGAKPPLRPKHVWAVRTRFHLLKRFRDLALFLLRRLLTDPRLRLSVVCRPHRARSNPERLRSFAVTCASLHGATLDGRERPLCATSRHGARPRDEKSAGAKRETQHTGHADRVGSPHHHVEHAGNEERATVRR
jgi:hypothetical protein